MMPLELQIPPAFHLQPFVAEPSRSRRGRWVSYLGVAAVLVAALLDVGLALGARSARQAGGAGVNSALGDWLAELDQPQLSQPSIGASR
jgi:hypothetical protein